jgi:hypothetical protein
MFGYFPGQLVGDGGIGSPTMLLPIIGYLLPKESGIPIQEFGIFRELVMLGGILGRFEIFLGLLPQPGKEIRIESFAGKSLAIKGQIRRSGKGDFGIAQFFWANLPQNSSYQKSTCSDSRGVVGGGLTGRKQLGHQLGNGKDHKG